MSSIKLLTAFLFISVTVFSQTPLVKVIESGKRVSLRGLSVVDDDIVWASGSGGNVARSTNGGASFTWTKVPGYEKMDFRDIEAFDSSTAIIMGITAPAVILKTTDGGATWKKVFEDTTKGAFLDAMDFADDKHGVIVGDPLDQYGYMLTTSNQGDSWEKTDASPRGAFAFSMKEGEAFFASSGTNIKMMDRNNVVFASGGKSSGLFFAKHRDSLPIMQGKESTGANSIAVYRNKKAVVVGGDFSKDTISSNNCVLIDLGRQVKFTQPQTPPHGYRSCVIYLNEKDLLTCGTSGIDISHDGGMNWIFVAKDSYHVCQKAKKGSAVFLAGNGKIGKLVM